ncbi:protein shisa-8-like [Engraulis encrasicolus]|uniref:protein shisa-8-like n=1 Tax=Engraulis encrasicolus TaxID=184585 RepID=UPI002FD70DE2
MGQTQNMRLVVCVLVLLWTLQSVSARGGRGGGRGRGRGGYVGANCETYYINGESQWHSCGRHEFCCGDCEHRSCCSDSLKELTLEEQNQCYNSEENHKRKLEEERSLFDGVDWKTSWQIICGIIAGIIILMLRLFCLAKVTGSFPGDGK